MLSASVSIVLLSIGILFVGRWLAVMLVVSLVAAYWLISVSITPYLRHAYRQKMRLDTESTSILLETLGSIRDIQLTGSEAYFREKFVSTGEEYFLWMNQNVSLNPGIEALNWVLTEA